MNFSKNLKQFQKYLKDNAIDFAIVFSNDEFLKENANLNINSRYLISGFTGTAGDMLVSSDTAFIFVDGRYHIQVDEQVDLNNITPIKLEMKEKMNEKIVEFFEKENVNNPKILISSKKISVQRFENLKKTFSKFNPEFIKDSGDIVCKFFATNKQQDVYKVWKLGIDIVGKTTEQKLQGLRKYENDYLLICSNDEICYLANIRSNQTPYSSSLDAIALVGEHKLHIFTQLSNISTELKNDNCTIFHDFSEFEDFLNEIKTTVSYISAKTPLFYIEKLKEKNIPIAEVKNSIIANKKAVKNVAELKYIKECYRKSDIALFNAITFLNGKIKNGIKITTKDFMEKLIALQKEQGVIELSFNPILAINERSAIIHCTSFDETQEIKNGDFILLDFGVYFEGGYATDMTRTFVVGEKYNNILLKQVYTIVLKAFLNTLNYKITPQTTFFDLDKKARDVIKKYKIEGFSFNHGTGHGIGLNVHEMPPVLSPSKLAQKKVKANMIFSIEPGMYKENIGGVRLENSVYTQKIKNGIKIETLTNLPFDEKLIIFELLNKNELKWLQSYQEKAIK